MMVLYAFQGTGNGHLTRAQEIVPLLKKYVKVDTLISGHQSQLASTFQPDLKYRGISLLYNKNGGLSYRKTLSENHFFKASNDISEIDLRKYDLVINDFEPITAWACKLRNLPLIELSHQAALSFAETPKPREKNLLGEKVLQYYAPSTRKIGFHFKSYHRRVKTPVIRQKIRELNPKRLDHFVVYLPAFSDENIFQILQQVKVQWMVFSKYTKSFYCRDNVRFFPVEETLFLKHFETCRGILCSAGFETPAEALFMQKQLLVIPIKKQYEQLCNAAALEEMGIRTCAQLNVDAIKNWIYEECTVEVNYPDDIEDILLNEVLTLR